MIVIELRHKMIVGPSLTDKYNMFYSPDTGFLKIRNTDFNVYDASMHRLAVTCTSQKMDSNIRHRRFTNILLELIN